MKGILQCPTSSDSIHQDGIQRMAGAGNCFSGSCCLEIDHAIMRPSHSGIERKTSINFKLACGRVSGKNGMMRDADPTHVVAGENCCRNGNILSAGGKGIRIEINIIKWSGFLHVINIPAARSCPMIRIITPVARTIHPIIIRSGNESR